MSRRNTRSKNLGLATLKAVATQYSTFDNMLEQISLMHSEFESELLEILQTVDNNCQPESSNTSSTSISHADINDSPNSTSPSDDISIDTDSIDETDNSPPIKQDDWIRKLFKRIALQCHPDKVLAANDSTEIKHQKLVMYNKARTALDDSNRPLMVSIGVMYNEVPSIGIKKSKDILLAGINMLEETITTKRKSIAWAWGMSEDDFCIKAKLLTQAAEQAYGGKISDNKALEIVKTFFNVQERIAKRKSGEHPGPSIKSRRKNSAD